MWSAGMGLGAPWAEGTAGKANTPEGREERNTGHWLTERGEDKALNGAEECSWELGGGPV